MINQEKQQEAQFTATANEVSINNMASAIVDVAYLPAKLVAASGVAFHHLMKDAAHATTNAGIMTGEYIREALIPVPNQQPNADSIQIDSAEPAQQQPSTQWRNRITAEKQQATGRSV